MMHLYTTIFGLIFLSKHIVDFVFPTSLQREPELIRVRNYTMARYITSDFIVLDFIGLVERHGYPAEEHKITTEDGYEIMLHRIPGSPNNPKAKGKPVIYIQHGLFASSDTWVLMGPQKDLAFIAAEAGYDVWLGNIRGNSYGRSHVKLSPDTDPEFWRFSYQEIALNDVTAMIDHILDTTREKSLIYIGHSMGTTISYILLSTKPEYNSKIHLLISLSPIAFWKHQIPPHVMVFIKNADIVKEILEQNRIYEILPQSTTNIIIGNNLCSDKSLFQPVCISMIFQLSGVDVEQLNTTILPYVFSYFPAGASVQTVHHYAQNIIEGTLQTYDYGKQKNLEKYNQTKPPYYDLNNIIVPVALIYGDGDILSTKANVAELKKHLFNVITSERVPFKSFNHMDFIWARDVKTLVYDRIMILVSKYRHEGDVKKIPPI